MEISFNPWHHVSPGDDFLHRETAIQILNDSFKLYQEKFGEKR